LALRFLPDCGADCLFIRCLVAAPSTLNAGKTVHRVALVLIRWPRVSAACGFSVAGTALSLLWWSPLIFQTQATLPFALFVVTPGIAAAVAGGAIGKPLFDSSRVQKPQNAALRGAVIASFALLLFAPLFATLYVWTEPTTEHTNILGLAVAMLIGGAFAVWWQVALMGAIVGWGLHRLASRGG
jgi:hypothetical protein